MPLYEYFCEDCSLTTNVIKPMANASDPEICTRCGRSLNRIYNPPQIHMGTTTPNASVRNDMARYKDNNPGSEMAPTGDFKNLKKPKQDYSLSKEDLHGIDKMLATG